MLQIKNSFLLQFKHNDVTLTENNRLPQSKGRHLSPEENSVYQLKSSHLPQANSNQLFQSKHYCTPQDQNYHHPVRSLASSPLLQVTDCLLAQGKDSHSTQSNGLYQASRTDPHSDKAMASAKVASNLAASSQPGSVTPISVAACLRAIQPQPQPQPQPNPQPRSRTPDTSAP